MARFDLSEAEWAIISPHLLVPCGGARRVDDRRVVDGIFYILRTARRGVISLSATVPTRLSTTASIDGRRKAYGSTCSRH